MAKVSILIPVHDDEAHVAECLASVERQTLRDIEVICIDDASHDESARICELFAESDSRFRVVRQPDNKGAAACRNLGLDLATGTYVAFMDSDDWYPGDTCLERLYEAAEKSGLPLAAGSIDRFDESQGAVRELVAGEEHLAGFTFESEGVIDYRAWQFDYGFTRFLYKREFLRDNDLRFPPLIRHEDPVFLVKALIAAGRFYAIPDVVYRIRMGHKSTVLEEKALDDALQGIAEVLALSYEHDLPLLRRWQKDLMKLYVVDSAGVLGEFFLKDLAAEMLQRSMGKVAGIVKPRIVAACRLGSR